MKKKRKSPAMRDALAWLEDYEPAAWGPVRNDFMHYRLVKVGDLWLEYRDDVLRCSATRALASRPMFSRVLKMLGARPRMVRVEVCRARQMPTDTAE